MSCHIISIPYKDARDAILVGIFQGINKDIFMLKPLNNVALLELGKDQSTYKPVVKSSDYGIIFRGQPSSEELILTLSVSGAHNLQRI